MSVEKTSRGYLVRFKNTEGVLASVEVLGELDTIDAIETCKELAALAGIRLSAALIAEAEGREALKGLVVEAINELGGIPSSGDLVAEVVAVLRTQPPTEAPAAPQRRARGPRRTLQPVGDVQPPTEAPAAPSGPAEAPSSAEGGE